MDSDRMACEREYFLDPWHSLQNEYCVECPLSWRLAGGHLAWSIDLFGIRRTGKISPMLLCFFAFPAKLTIWVCLVNAGVPRVRISRYDSYLYCVLRIDTSFCAGAFRLVWCLRLLILWNSMVAATIWTCGPVVQWTGCCVSRCSAYGQSGLCRRGEYLLVFIGKFD